MAEKQHDCFISYAKENREYAEKLFIALKRRGVNPWMDKPPRPYRSEGLRPGETWEARLRQEISGCKMFLPLFSTVSVAKAGYVQSEFRQALRRISLLPVDSIFIIPIRIEDCSVPRINYDGVSFDQLQWVDCFDGDFSEVVDAVCRELISTFRAELASQATREATPGDGIAFYDAISSNAKVNLDGELDISSAPMSVRREIFVEEVFDGHQIVISGVERLRLEGRSHLTSSLLVSPRYANVLEFNDCRDVLIRNLRLGHGPESGECQGGVVKLKNCHDFELQRCDLFGCGTYAFILEDCERVRFSECILRDCTYGIATLERSRGIELVGCQVYGNSGFDGFTLAASDLYIGDSEIRGNSGGGIFSVSQLFRCTASRVSMSGVTLSGNQYSLLTDNSTLAMGGANMFGNAWDRPRSGP